MYTTITNKIEIAVQNLWVQQPEL